MPVHLYREQRKHFIAGVEQTGLFQNGQKIWTKPDGFQWFPIVPTDGGPNVGSTSFRGLVTQNADGSYRVTSAPGNTNGRALVTFADSILPGTQMIVQSNLVFNGASRLILRQVENNDSTGGITLFDVLAANVGPTYTVTNQFGMVSNRRFLHYIGVTPTGAFFTINPQTRWRFV